jgi:hypothetical protein
MIWQENKQLRGGFLMKQKRMKMTTWTFSLAAFFLLLCWASVTQAQGNQDEPNYESKEEFEKSKQEFGKGEEEKPPISIWLGKEEREERPEWTSKDRWGGWGGPMVGQLTLDLSCLDPMTRDRDISGFDETMTVVGGMGGMAYSPSESAGWWRFGGMGFGIEQSESERVGGQTRKAKMGIGGGGLFVEYHYPVFSRLDVGMGGLVGAGSITLRAEGDDLGIIDGTKWSESEGFWLGYPYAGMSLKVMDWLRLEATAGYLFMDADLSGAEFYIDDSDMDMTDGGPQYMLRLLFGYQLEKKEK